MKKYKRACFLLMLISCTACAYGQIWKQYADSAKVFEEQKKSDKAIELYSKSREELNKDSISTNTYASLCNNLANLYRDIAQYDRAEPLYLEGKQIQEKLFGKEHIDYANSCNNLAILYFYMGQYEKVEPLFLEVKQIREKVLGKNNAEYANSCNNLANLYSNIGKYEKAELLYLEAKGILEKILGKNNIKYTNSCYNLGNVYFFMGKYEKAEPLYLEAKEIQEKVLGKDNPSYANSTHNLANFYSEMGQYEKVEPLHLEAKQIREKVLGKNHPNYAQSCFSLANFYSEMGWFEKVEPLLLEAKQIQEKVLSKNHPDYAKSCLNLAIFYSEMGQYEKAEPLYLEAKQISEKVLGKDHPDYAQSCNNLANLYRDIGKYKMAEPLFMEAKQIREKVLGKHHPNYAKSCTGLAILYSYMGQYTKVEPLFLEAKQIQEKVLGKNNAEYANSCHNLAYLHWLQHEPLQAEKEFEESFSINSYNLFSIFQFTNEKEKASYIKNVAGEDDIAYSFYASENIASGQPYSLSLFHRNLILSSSQALKKQLYGAKDTALRNTYNQWMNVRKYLSILYTNPIDERKENTDSVEEKADQLERELIRLSPAFAKQQQRVDWKDIQNKLQPDEASIEFVSFHYTDGKRKTNTIIYAALVLRKDILFPTTVVLFREKQLKNIFSATSYKTTKAGVQRLYTLNSMAINDKKGAKKSIYDLVWKPLEKELTGIKTVYFSPSGLLHRIAFAALPINKEEVLSDRYKLVQLSTTATVADQQPYYVTDSDKVQLYGGISYNVDTTALKDVAFTYRTEKTISRSLPDDLIRSGRWNGLPGTIKEIEGIVSLSGTYKSNITSQSGINATEENIKSLDGTASPAVLHIATHGFFFPDPKQNKNDKGSFESGKVFKSSDDPLMRSGLLFAGANNAWQNKPVDGIDDGILTAYEVSNLYLPNTKLVVLSACETGLGDIKGNEGVYGLQRAFKIAGVHNLVMSLWKVSDQETAEFMEAFYKNMFAQQTISYAFHNAQNVMKNKYRGQPYKWAAWILVR